MGCFWSNEDRPERCIHCSRRAVNHLHVVNNVCEICSSSVTNIEGKQRSYGIDMNPRFGEYRCSCGKVWTSRRARSNVYEICERCGSRNYPVKTKELQRSNNHMIKTKDPNKKHKRELCQMCQQLGRDCNNLNNKRSRSEDYRGKLYW